MAWVLHFDGLCEPVNPGGISTFGFVVRRDGGIVHEERGLVSGPGPDSTNNVAEYTGIVRGLEWLAARDLAGEPVSVRGDSQLVIEQVRGKWKAREERILHLVTRARELVALLCVTDVAWVPREENEEANRLTEVAYEEAVAANPGWLAQVRLQPASARQRAQMAELGIPAPDGMDRREAARAIDKVVKERRRLQPP